MQSFPETVRHMDHEQRQICRIRDAGGGNVHAVFEPPGLFGVPEVKLQLEPQGLVVDQQRVGQCPITAEQDDMGVGVGAQIGLHEDHDV
jgi:hypothetical protein